MDLTLYKKIEEYLNINENREYHLKTEKIDPVIVKSVDGRIKNYEKEDTLYFLLLKFIRRMKKPYFIKKNGELDEAKFYNYARIDKTTWSNIRWNKGNPRKVTLLKLIIALKLNEQEANEVMHKASNSFNMTDFRDLIILALIDIKCYEIETVYEVLEEYGKNGAVKFSNIYGEIDE